jgi:hypothetical protein
MRYTAEIPGWAPQGKPNECLRVNYLAPSGGAAGVQPSRASRVNDLEGEPHRFRLGRLPGNATHQLAATASAPCHDVQRASVAKKLILTGQSNSVAFCAVGASFAAAPTHHDSAPTGVTRCALGQRPTTPHRMNAGQYRPGNGARRSRFPRETFRGRPRGCGVPDAPVARLRVGSQARKDRHGQAETRWLSTTGPRMLRRRGQAWNRRLPAQLARLRVQNAVLIDPLLTLANCSTR